MNVLGVILGGGTGSRLKPLTVNRAKPAVPLAGKYRLVDIPISNCINSQIFQLYLLTQYNSASLHHHVQATYQFDQFSRGFVHLLAAEKALDSGGWFQGTADAVRQTLHHFRHSRPDYILILAGDQLFRMDFREVIRQHIEARADLTVCATPVSRQDASALGVLHCRPDGVIDNFVEKPSTARLTEELAAPGSPDTFLASMGIYLFSFSALEELLRDESRTDFGSHIIPNALQTHRVCGYIFNGYWKDIGTIRAFWQTNLELCSTAPPFDFHVRESRVFTRPRFLPPANVQNSTLDRVILSEGAVVDRATLENSVIGLRAVIGAGSLVRDTVVMGCDSYESEAPQKHIALGIGKNCRIDKAIIDKDVRIGNDVVISPEGLDEMETELFSVRDGIIVIPKGVVLPDGWRVSDAVC